MGVRSPVLGSTRARSAGPFVVFETMTLRPSRVHATGVSRGVKPLAGTGGAEPSTAASSNPPPAVVTIIERSSGVNKAAMVPSRVSGTGKPPARSCT